MSLGQFAHTDASESGAAPIDKASPHPTDTDPIRVGTLARFLIGERNAILKVAHSEPALWLGLAFVICAGLFREYDQEDLLHEPWHVGIPLLVSTVLSALLLLVLKILIPVRKCSLPAVVESRRLLTCVWMCAPMAILYAIPVESVSSPLGAAQWNTLFLGVVSAWRVILITRVVSVLYEVSVVRVVFPVMLLSSTSVIVAMMVIPLPLLQIMGGIQLTDAEQFVNQVRGNVIVWSVLSWPVWFVGTLVAGAKTRQRRFDSNVANVSEHPPPPSAPLARSMWSVVAVMALGIGWGCWRAQPAQQRRFRFASIIRTGDLETAIDYVSDFLESDFPPHWEPPPRISYREQQPDVFDMIRAATLNESVPAWVLDRYGEKLVQLRGFDMHAAQFWSWRSPEEVETIALFLKRRPDWIQKIEAGEWTQSIAEFVNQTLENRAHASLEKTSGPGNEISNEILLMLVESVPEGDERVQAVRQRIERESPQSSGVETDSL